MQHAGAGDAEAKGVIERWHRTWREEVEDEHYRRTRPVATVSDDDDTADDEANPDDDALF